MKKQKKFSDDTPLGEVRKWNRENWEGDGTDCGACGQNVRLWNYKFFTMNAVALVVLYRLSRQRPSETYFHTKEFAEAIKGLKPRSPHYAEMRFWGLIQEFDKKTSEKNASGFWRITEKGKQFAQGKITVKSHIRIYNNHFVRFEGKEIDIREALISKKYNFDYAEMMKGFEDDDDKNGQGELF